MVVTPCGITTLDSFLHQANAISSMEITPFGKMTPVRLSQPQNARFPMEDTPSGITTSPPLPVYLVKTPFEMNILIGF